MSTFILGVAIGYFLKVFLLSTKGQALLAKVTKPFRSIKLFNK